ARLRAAGVGRRRADPPGLRRARARSAPARRHQGAAARRHARAGRGLQRRHGAASEGLLSGRRMPSLHSLLIFTLAAAAMNISPGPSNLYVMSRSLAQGARAGLVAALGLATGSLFHVTVTALGLSIVLRYSPALYAVVKLVGAAYLIFLGLRLLLSKSAALTAAASGNRRPHGRIFRESILVEM